MKHLLVFLLVFLVSVADAAVYSQKTSSEYHQSSKIIQKRKLSNRNIKFLAFKKPFSSSYFLAFFFSKMLLKSDFVKQIALTLKLQKQLYQRIVLLNSKHTFLINRNTGSNSISNLYIA